MNTTDQLEAEILRLPPRDRERLALTAWESLAADNTWVSSSEFDSEGVAIARQRDDEMEAGAVQPLSREEFHRRTRSTTG